MAEPSQRLFRSRALERASTPDRLDQIIEVVSPKDWLPLVVLGILLALGLAWSIVGRLPMTVTGRGVLIYPGRVVDVQTLGAGRLAALSVKAGDRIRAGDVVALVDQFDLRRRLSDDRVLLAELQAQDRAKISLQGEQSRLQRQQTELHGAFARSQAESLRRSLADAEAMKPLLKRRLEGFRAMAKEGLVADFGPELMNAEQADRDNDTRIVELAAQLKQLDVQLKQTETIETALTHTNLEADTARRTAMQELRSRIAINELQLEHDGRIVAPRGGRVLEVLAVGGQIVAAGQRIATIEAEGNDDALVSVSYFAVGDGKKVQPGMRVQVAPDTAERQRYGGITGVVTSVSKLPVTIEASRVLVGNLETVQALLQGGPRIEVVATLDRDPSTPSRYRWSSSTGPRLTMTAGLTTSVRVTVESRAPITYILPFLREITGVY